jgi:hypothetical protein
MKYQLSSLILILFMGNISCQNEVTTNLEIDPAERVVDKTCSELSEDKSSIQEYQNTLKGLIQNDSSISKAYTTELSIFKEIPQIEDKLEKYINFILKRDCKKYRELLDKLDKNYEDKLLIRKAYLINRNIVYALFDNEQPKTLIKYFDVENEEKLEEHLKQIISKLKKGKRKAFLNTSKLNVDKIAFHNSLKNYVSGNETLMLVLEFDSSGEKITKYAFNYGEIKIVEF